ncbi:N-acetyltransferase family protein [Parapedobacter sp. 2B3]|uniref:GNAT family N-acetyltransferase n=1 Tax=Parapedobacter sp. 2B3 TaxID=3342381 RepID=UPI0035B5EA50
MYTFRKAQLSELPQIWEIIQQAIARRKAAGSEQWQDGYPNPEVLRSDIAKGAGFVLAEGETVVGYCAVTINDEPAYTTIDGKWLTDGDFVVFHRIAVAHSQTGKGLAKKIMEHIETFATDNHIRSIKADTNFDNPAMLRTFESMGYTYCGEVLLRGKPRKAFEKLLPGTA